MAKKTSASVPPHREVIRLRFDENGGFLSIDEQVLAALLSAQDSHIAAKASEYLADLRRAPAAR